MFHYRDWYEYGSGWKNKEMRDGPELLSPPRKPPAFAHCPQTKQNDQLFDVKICNQQQKKDIIFSL